VNLHTEREIPDEDEMEFEWVPTTNFQYSYDTEDSLYGILEMEFGFRDSYPHQVAQHCLSLQKKYQCDTASAVWLGSGAGRGPLELTRGFQNVSRIQLVLPIPSQYIETPCINFIHILREEQ
jgi:hypothetical protein